MLTQTVTDEKGTAALAKTLRPLLKTGDVITLKGGLGAGKTAFARALIGEKEVPSPTFTLVQTYTLPEIEIWHFDLYRLTDPEEVFELGWEEALSSGASLVEWPERLGGLLPVNRLEIDIRTEPENQTTRHFVLTPFGTWEKRLEEMKKP